MRGQAVAGASVNKLELHFATPLIVKHEFAVAPTIYSRLTITYERFTITAQGDVMYTLPVDKFIKMKVSYFDRGGNPAEVDGPVVWTSSGDDILRLTVDASDSTIVTVTPTGTIGAAQITATADADLGSGVTTLKTLCDIDVVSGQAVAGSIQPIGEAQPIP